MEALEGGLALHFIKDVGSSVWSYLISIGATTMDAINCKVRWGHTIYRRIKLKNRMLNTAMELVHFNCKFDLANA